MHIDLLHGIFFIGVQMLLSLKKKIVLQKVHGMHSWIENKNK